ncbi:GABA permease [Scopulibacillus daqui]|uniref:GABA permease n=1 Tax=Scopulibacillus daqui TaxID=1469162 RepID=A0ABS2Q252_9BACL|nr:amino acid permease [Scopulibacillus daqui]MBM7646283.1 GABA permease [Scopulibacillus daqui]
MAQSEDLQKHLKKRHVIMITIGGIIGAGLFVGSGAIIKETGPAAIFTYLLTGLLVLLIARMLGEMASAYPGAGSFSEQVRLALGNWAGFSCGWLYWYFWVVVVAFEATAGAGILKYWFANAPLWLLSLSLIVLLTLTNIFSVKSYGEFEYWFAAIKVVAVILFIILGAAYILGLWPAKTMSFENLTAHGGFAPHGIAAILKGVVVVIFSFLGTEIATVTAAESDQPKEAIAGATRSVIWRILIFYVGSAFIMVCILPWNQAGVLESPFVSVLEKLGIPGAGQIMNFVVLTAALSCLNSGLYVASRMLFNLAKRGDAPKWFTKVNKKGVPMRALLSGTVIGYLSVIAAYYSPDLIFQFLLNSSGVVVLYIYLFVAFAQLKMRARLEKENPQLLVVKMWGYPYLTYFTIICMAAVLVLLAFDKSMRSQLLLSTFSLFVVLTAYAVRSRKASVNPFNNSAEAPKERIPK